MLGLYLWIDHKLLLAKLNEYGFDKNLSNSWQRINISYMSIVHTNIITKKYNHQVPLIFKRHLGISKKRIRLKVCSKADKEINYTWQNAQFFKL